MASAKQKTSVKRAAARANRAPGEKEFTKRRTVAEGLALADAAHAAVWRLYCDVFKFWRACRVKRCRRHRRCDGEPAACLMRGLPSVPEAERQAAAAAVIAGGPRRIPPATHLEWICAASRCRSSPPGGNDGARNARDVPAREAPADKVMPWRSGGSPPRRASA